MISDGRLENKSLKEDPVLNSNIMGSTANTMMVETVSEDFQNVNLTYKKEDDEKSVNVMLIHSPVTLISSIIAVAFAVFRCVHEKEKMSS